MLHAMLELVMRDKISRIYLVNKYGDNAEPCLVPLCMANDLDYSIMPTHSNILMRIPEC